MVLHRGQDLAASGPVSAPAPGFLRPGTFSPLPGKATSPVSVGLITHQLVELPLGGAQPALPWHYPSTGDNGLSPALKVLYGDLCNPSMRGTTW